MKNILSLVACIVISIALLQYRTNYSDIKPGNPPLKLTEWDAFGYYMYLPSICIYHDCKDLKWLGEIDKKYAVTGGNGYEAEKQANGNYVFKYLGGIAILEFPFFFIGHWIAVHYGYPPDGFSAPYQYALGFGIILYCILAIFLLRKILLLYFKDLTVAITLVMVCLATNFILYAAIHNALSHAYIFPLYVLVLYTTIKWHQHPRLLWAALTGYIIGLATICRPTEAIMLFIPLFWNTHNKVSAKEKWSMVKQHKTHVIFAICFGIIGILPQLIYWKITSGSFIYDVGSSWDFLNPHFRVLFGWEKGWFIYTPITVFFIIGMFYMKQFPFKRSVLWFCLLNIYIIISWRDWQYGGSYSTRALVQGYPLFALAFAAFTEKIMSTKWRIIFYPLCAFLLFVNLFQVKQYCSNVIHYCDMNRLYYSRIYLNPDPSPVDMSLLDNDEIISNETKYHKEILAQVDSAIHVHFEGNLSGLLIQSLNVVSGYDESWLKIDCTIQAPGYLWNRYLNAALQARDSVKHTRVRLFNAISRDQRSNKYAFYMRIPQGFRNSQLKLYLTSPSDFNGTVEKITVTELGK